MGIAWNCNTFHNCVFSSACESGLDLCRYPLFVLRCSLAIPDYSLQPIWEIICWSLNVTRKDHVSFVLFHQLYLWVDDCVNSVVLGWTCLRYWVGEFIHLIAIKRHCLRCIWSVLESQLQASTSCKVRGVVLGVVYIVRSTQSWCDISPGSPCQEVLRIAPSIVAIGNGFEKRSSCQPTGRRQIFAMYVALAKLDSIGSLCMFKHVFSHVVHDWSWCYMSTRPTSS